MFVADLVLYFPTTHSDPHHHHHRGAASYFATIDPGGAQLAQSSMQHVSIRRALCGGAMGPVSAVFYNIGFFGLYFGLQQQQQQQQQHGDDNDNDNNSYDWVLPATAAIGLSLMMTIAAVYHALFAYTCFLSKEIAKVQTPNGAVSSCDSLHNVLRLHQSYLRYLYKWAVLPGMVGSAAYVYCCLVRTNTVAAYPPLSVVFVPVLSGPVKKYLKKHNLGGIVICGGLTNLWNLCFFAVLGLGAR